MYHVVQGTYYSQDLRDGQFLPSILEGQYLQAGVRVDGCSRKSKNRQSEREIDFETLIFRSAGGGECLATVSS